MELLKVDTLEAAREKLKKAVGERWIKSVKVPLKDAMMVTPVIVCCFEGVGAIEAVRMITGPTTGRKAPAGTIRGDYSMSFQENIVHASDSPETAEAELKRFFKPEEIFEYKQSTFDNLYANDEF